MHRENNTHPESLEYRTEVKQLLDILAHSLYTDRDIFLRELISNASDALSRIHFEMLTNSDIVDADAELAISIEVNEDQKRITIHDTGIGMNRDEMIENLGTIAHSGAKDFLQGSSSGNGEQAAVINEIIGQFGVGFYSAFMVASEITVTSRSYRPEEDAWQWHSDGTSEFSLFSADQEERGTQIELVLKADAHDYASKWKLESIIKKHSDYVSYPIYVSVAEKDEEASPADNDNSDANALGDETIEIKPEPQPVNHQTAIWRQTPSELDSEAYEAFYKQLTYDWNSPLAQIHFITDAPADIRSLLYIPSRRDQGAMAARQNEGLKLYSRKILIAEEYKDLLPEYYGFIRGVVDSEDLPLNVSRETVQSNPLIRQIKKALTNRVSRELKRLAEKEPETYTTFWNEFGIFLKDGVAREPDSHDVLLDLLRFHSSHIEQTNDKAENDTADEVESTNTDSEIENTEIPEQPEVPIGQIHLTSLQAYVERMKDGQEDIYYVLGDNLETAELSPHLDYFQVNQLEVLYLVDPIDGYMISSLREYKGKSLKNVDDSSLELPESSDQKNEPENDTEALAEADFDKVVARFKDVLGERVTDVQESKQLVSSPCRLVTPSGGMDRDLQRLMRLTQENYQMPTKLLELNRNHHLINGLAQLINSKTDDKLIVATVEQLFGNAMLLEGIHPNPAEMVNQIQSLMETAVDARLS